jgi:hypothetical protein
MKHLFILFTVIFILNSCSNKNKKSIISDNKIQVDTSISTPINSSNNVETKFPTQIKAITEDVFEDDTVQGNFDGCEYVLYPHGMIKFNHADNYDTIQLTTDLLIAEAYFYSFKDNLVIYYADTDMESGGSYIECYDSDYNLSWKQDIYAFNLTKPIVIDSLTFVASFGFAGKLNLNNGKYLWKHTDLYEETRFDAFGSIEFDGENIRFIESLWINDTREPGEVIINNKTGEIKEIIKNAL